MSSATSFKIYFSNAKASTGTSAAVASTIRRFRMANRPRYDEFIGIMCKQYPLDFHPELRIQYVDTEGDKIDVNSQLEWEEMFVEQCNDKDGGDGGLVKIYVVEGSTGGGYFKDGPLPQAMHFLDSNNNQVLPDDGESLKIRIPQCLQELFPSKKILPHNVPSFLSECLKVIGLPNNEVDLHVDIHKLTNTLFRKGLDALNEKNYQLGKNLFYSLTHVKPNDPICHYNLACAQSLLGNINEAILGLTKAVECGFRDVNHMRNDDDLENVRHLDAFQQLCHAIQQMTDRISQQPQTSPEPTIQPQPVSQTPSQPQSKPHERETKTQPEPVVTPIDAISPCQTEIPCCVSEKPVETPIGLTNSIGSMNLSDSMLMDPNALLNGRHKWSKELEVLHELGFAKDSVLIPLLEVNGGSVENTVQELLM